MSWGKVTTSMTSFIFWEVSAAKSYPSRGVSSLEKVSPTLDPNFNQPEIPTFHETNTGSLFPLTIGSMGLVCEWLIFYGQHVGKYTVRPMDPMDPLYFRSWKFLDLSKRLCSNRIRDQGGSRWERVWQDPKRCFTRFGLKQCPIGMARISQIQAQELGMDLGHQS